MRRLLARIAYRLLRPELDDLAGDRNPIVLQQRTIALMEDQGPRLREAIIAMVNDGDGGRIREYPPRY